MLPHLLGQLVRSAIDQGRIGTPVAARCLVSGEADRPLPQTAAIIADLVCSCLQAEPAQLWARGGESLGHLSVQIHCRTGQMLLVAAGAPGRQRPLTELVLLGNRGMLHWEGSEADELLANHESDAVVTPRAERLARAINVALGSGEPVDVEQPQARGLCALPTQPAPRAHPRPRIAPSAAPLGVLLINGNQSHQENYARSFAADPRCRLIGLTDEPGLSARRQQLNAELAAELNIPLLGEMDAAIERDDVQIICICAAPERRARIIERCARTGKHLYLDKPLAAGVEESDAIVAALRDAPIVQQMFSLVHTSLSQRVRRVVESGAIGELLAVHCDAFFAKGPGGTAQLGAPRRETARPTQFEQIEAKRELHNVGVYALVLIRWLLGRDTRRIVAHTGNFFFAEHQRLDMEDYAQATLELDGGVLATVATGRVGWRLHPSGGMNRVLLVGTRGTVAVDAHLPRLDVWADEEPWPMPSRHPEDPMGFWTSTCTASGAVPKRSWLTPPEPTDDIRYFVDCVVEGRPSDVPVEIAAHVMEVLIAAYESAASQKAVTLPIARQPA